MGNDVLQSSKHLEPAMSDKEIRTGIPLEIRADDGGEIRVSGYAAVFG